MDKALKVFFKNHEDPSEKKVSDDFKTKIKDLLK